MAKLTKEELSALGDHESVQVRKIEDLTVALAAAASAIVHYEEFLVTGVPLDLTAAEAMMRTPALADWIKANKVLLPVKRD